MSKKAEMTGGQEYNVWGKSAIVTGAGSGMLQVPYLHLISLLNFESNFRYQLLLRCHTTQAWLLRSNRRPCTPT